MPLQKKDLQLWGWRIHKAFGYTLGVQYMMLRERAPGVAKGNGLLFGTAFFALFDEIMVPALGWTPWGNKFSWQPHARGAVSHLAYGVAAETIAKALDQFSNLRKAA